MKIILVHNPHSGSSMPVKELRAKCKAHGIVVEKFIPVGNGFEQEVKRSIKKNRIIAAIGGDGTLSSVAGVLAGTDALFAPLSGGTLNHFTKDLGISQDLDEALKNLAKKRVKKIDVATVNGMVFINNSSMGLYPHSLHVRERFEDRLGKWPAAVIGSLRALRLYRSYNVTLSGKQIKTPFIFIGNNDYHLDEPTSGGRRRLNQGVLSVYTINAGSRWKLIKILGHALVGQLSDTSEMKVWTAKTVTIQTKTKKKIRISRDGELEKLETPLEYKILPKALNIIGSS